MANINFKGHITADAEIKYGNDGKPRTSFTVPRTFGHRTGRRRSGRTVG